MAAPLPATVQHIHPCWFTSVALLFCISKVLVDWGAWAAPTACSSAASNVDLGVVGMRKRVQLALHLLVLCGGRAWAGPSPPAPCGSLDLGSPLTQHCFPEDGSHHFVCCERITLLDNPDSPHGNQNPLGEVIRAASDPSNYSWCTCSEEICTQQLGGRVAWNQHGAGWTGFRPSSQRAYNARTGLEGGAAAEEERRREEL